VSVCERGCACERHRECERESEIERERAERETIVKPNIMFAPLRRKVDIRSVCQRERGCVSEGKSEKVSERERGCV